MSLLGALCVMLLAPLLLGFAVGYIVGQQGVIDDARTRGRTRVYGKWFRVTATKEPSHEHEAKRIIGWIEECYGPIATPPASDAAGADKRDAEKLMTALMRANVALAHAATNNPLYDSAYEESSAVIAALSGGGRG